ncbi:MAG: sodium:proton antiporter [Zetaproteobacteria bacterium CG12_big_fil_rev_8_21_14_0_65_55_1124]|nr:MAG: sodium:proton antiporter [Zetaproteobacteria bacterium CG1_02_55_237]PIS18719.1 MAG: sodium:proton antiporter [Zetaproteobacteria bacterium CG08_land_8_20_14_0_20_55_17]PIW43950.1 MAG: sodium:proton antiporter [Zetaproteobacteria bacterium CG12_big_fil_rev_8_21_14_0_65_55_1124]PIY52446.1 MAG: sodium:proton antiporter [Zetaproteobacteria bacterium CG_4_10_14_0_8_um_filter_55_43]PIZ36725.1 MAG: sodium:proton antiporter [Zetaproteobacteria bacterium CG_4_10_14_0_2_um_filter_55_20]PJB81039
MTIRTSSALITGIAAALFWPATAWASGGQQGIDLTNHAVGFAALALFFIAYVFVMFEEFTHLRKSKPVILAAGIMWALVAWQYLGHEQPHLAEEAVRHNILEYAELLLFLLVAMTYVNALEERQVFNSLKSWLIRKGFSYRKLFWVTGCLAFFISPVADNLTTALLMCAVILAVGAESPRFVGLSCINIVIAANAGGAFSPFGDITTLMVWQKGHVDFWEFFVLFVPAAVSYLIPAAAMHFAIPNISPSASDERIEMLRGAKRIMALFLATIITAVCFHNFLNLPPMLGMMTGLSYLLFFGYYLKKRNGNEVVEFDIFNKVKRAEWDTLLFFYGVVLCVGALGQIGYLALLSDAMYSQMGPLFANSMVGILSAIVDNIPVMFAVLSMHPEMSQGHWLLVTLTAGIGGSLLSIGSAAGVALMGQARGKYTFFGHLKWTPVIALGYVAGIATHLWINAAYF